MSWTTSICYKPGRVSSASAAGGVRRDDTRFSCTTLFPCFLSFVLVPARIAIHNLQILFRWLSLRESYKVCSVLLTCDRQMVTVVTPLKQ